MSALLGGWGELFLLARWSRLFGSRKTVYGGHDGVCVRVCSLRLLLLLLLVLLVVRWWCE